MFSAHNIIFHPNITKLTKKSCQITRKTLMKLKLKTLLVQCQFLKFKRIDERASLTLEYTSQFDPIWEILPSLDTRSIDRSSLIMVVAHDHS